MLFKNIAIIDENFDVKENMYVGIREDKISYISSEMPKEDYGESYDGTGKLLMPGFYNAHAHSPMTLMRGYGENFKLLDWLNNKIFPFEDRLTSNAIYWGTTLAMAESLRFGIVSTSDMYFFMDDMYKAIYDAKVKNNLSRSISQFDESDPKELPSFKETERALNSYHNTNKGKIKMDVSLHSEYTTKPWTVEAVSELGKKYNVIMQVHVSESIEEHEGCISRYNMTPVEYLNEHHAFDIPTVAAHCVQVTDHDIEILKEKNVTVASNPISNLKLASGVCNVPKLYKNGINVAIGTDSVASNNSLNFFEEMKTFAISSKMMFKDPTVVTPTEALYSATRAGAIAQGRMDCGLVKEGFKADLIVVDIMKPNMQPIYNLKNNLVYSASGSDVCLTMVDGEVLYKDEEYMTIDIEKTIKELDLARKEILSHI